jgi:hypothetical protein
MGLIFDEWSWDDEAFSDLNTSLSDMKTNLLSLKTNHTLPCKEIKYERNDLESMKTNVTLVSLPSRGLTLVDNNQNNITDLMRKEGERS